MLFLRHGTISAINFTSFTAMPGRPTLATLKKGLTSLKNSVKQCKEALSARLQRKESISSSDQRWLDGEANLVDDHEDVSDEAIYNAVIAAREVEQNLEINQGDDDDVTLLVPRPTRTEALQAVAVVRRYIDELSGDFARKLDLSLASLGRETRLERSKGLVEIRIDSYFTRKQSGEL